MNVYIPIPRRKRTVLAIVAVLALLVSALAIAAWVITTDNASGQGKVASLTAPTVVLDTGQPAIGDISPGASGSAYVLVSNPNSQPLTFTQAVDNPNGNFTSPGACPSNNFSITTSTTAVPTSVPANAVSFPMKITGLIHLSPTAPVGCMGVLVQANNKFSVSWTSN